MSRVEFAFPLFEEGQGYLEKIGVGYFQIVVADHDMRSRRADNQAIPHLAQAGERWKGDWIEPIYSGTEGKQIRSIAIVKDLPIIGVDRKKYRRRRLKSPYLIDKPLNMGSAPLKCSYPDR